MAKTNFHVGEDSHPFLSSSFREEENIHKAPDALFFLLSGFQDNPLEIRMGAL